MNELLILFTAVLFFIIGRLSKTPDETILKTIKEKARQVRANGIPTVLNYQTKEEKEYEGSEQEAIDKQIEQNLKNAGLEPK